MTNGQRIRRLRQIAGVSQQALGDAMGTSQTTVQMWEVGKFNMDDFRFEQAVRVLKEITEQRTLSKHQVEEKKKKTPPKQKVETKYCVGCTYWRFLAPVAQGGGKCCHYILDNERKRPCPPGRECTEYTKKNRVKRRWNGVEAYLVKERANGK